MAPRQILFNRQTDNRRAPQAATHVNAQQHFTVIRAINMQANVMHFYRGAILFGGRNRNFKFAR